ncbi:MAG TPA: sugar phosphate isomerase/epimerase family protein [bacterium]|nr:sugar phosphate isomerase/epimerase family protein [bacterium]HQL61155.1 sugar phosphate isomerase/epimerase family protein [bacterium]
MKFAICNETFQNWSWERTCPFVAKTGYQGIEVAPFTLADSVQEISPARRKEIAGIATDVGLEIVGLHWLLVSPKGLHLNHPEASIRKKTADYARALIDFCADIGGKIMVWGSPQQRNMLEGQTYRDTWLRTVDFFKGIAPHAENRGIPICFEPLTPFETNMITCADQARDLIDAVGSSHLRLHLDVKAMCGGERDTIPEVIEKNVDLLRHFHANDRNKRGPGFGDVDFKPIAAALKKIGYNGYVSVEVFDYSPDPETIARDSLSYLQKTFA